MKKSITTVKKLFNRMCVAIGLAALLSGIPNAANATQTVRELFSNLPNNTSVSDGTSINGMTNDFTSVGLSTGSWTNNPPNSFGVANSAIGYKGSFTVNWVFQTLQNNILPDSANGENGCIDSYPASLSTLTNPATMTPYDNWDPSLYATHPLDPSAYVNCSVPGTYWFSVRIVKNYGWQTGDSSAGLGLSTGNGPTDHFIGIGVTRPTALNSTNGDIGDTDYATYGTLGQTPIAGQTDTGGPYYPVATGPAQLFNSGVGAVNWAEAGLLVGRLVVSAGGSCEMDVLTILPEVVLPAGLPTNPSAIVWDATTTFTETNTLTQLLMWMHGPTLEYDAIRMGTSYADVVGLETIGSPNASPFNGNVYANTTASISDAFAQVNSGNTPASFQWLKGGIPIDSALNPTATNATLVLSNTITTDTGDYSVFMINAFGQITSPTTHVTVNPAAAPFFTTKPVPMTWYAGSTAATFSCGANGSPNFTYQWYQGVTPIGSPVTTSALNNTIALPTLTLGSAGAYSVTVQNPYGSTNSGAVNLTVISPPAGSYAAKVLSYAPWGYWRLDDNVTPANPAIYDEWGVNNGVAKDETAPTYQVPAVPYSGFPNPHLGLQLTNNVTCRVDLPMLPVWSNQMTLAFWVNNGAVQMCTMNGYGNGYGLYNNAGELIFEWASLGAPSASGGLDTTLNMQTLGYTNGWTFCAMVVTPTNATVYLGNNTSNLVSASLNGLALPDSTTAGDTAHLYPPGLGRMEWPYSEDGGGAGYNTKPGTWSDVAVFFSSLTPAQVTSLYVAGTGSWITGTPSGGILNLNWTQGCVLQQASTVNSPYTDVAGAPVPPYSVPIANTGNVFYRCRNN